MCIGPGSDGDGNLSALLACLFWGSLVLTGCLFFCATRDEVSGVGLFFEVGWMGGWMGGWVFMKGKDGGDEEWRLFILNYGLWIFLTTLEL